MTDEMLTPDTPCPPDIPPAVFDGLKMYVLNGIMPGSFLSAVLSNDLFMAIGCADPLSTLTLPNLVKYIHWNVPGSCHGSWDIVAKWTGTANRHALKNQQGR